MLTSSGLAAWMPRAKWRQCWSCHRWCAPGKPFESGWVDLKNKTHWIIFKCQACLRGNSTLASVYEINLWALDSNKVYLSLILHAQNYISESIWLFEVQSFVSYFWLPLPLFSLANDVTSCISCMGCQTLILPQGLVL
jgi:hypothetical protein